MNLDYISSSWKEWEKQHIIIRSCANLREWKLFLTLKDKKRHLKNPEWKSRFRSLGVQGYTQREIIVRELLNRFRMNLGIKRSNQFYWMAKHEFASNQNDPHIHVLIDFNRTLSQERLQNVLQPMKDGTWMQKEGFDLCFRLKNDPDLPIFIQDLEKARAYFGKDESQDTRSDKEIWSKKPPKVDGSLVFMSESFRKQIENTKNFLPL